MHGSFKLLQATITASKMRAVILAVLGMMCQAAMATIGEYWNELATPVYEVDGRSVKDATMARGSDGSYAIFYSGFYIGPRDEYVCAVLPDLFSFLPNVPIRALVPSPLDVRIRTCAGRVAPQR